MMIDPEQFVLARLCEPSVRYREPGARSRPVRGVQCRLVPPGDASVYPYFLASDPRSDARPCLLQIATEDHSADPFTLTQAALALARLFPIDALCWPAERLIVDLADMVALLRQSREAALPSAA